LATVSGEAPSLRVQLWDTEAGKARRVLHIGDRNSSYDKVFFSPDGKSLAAGGVRVVGKNGESTPVVTLWDVASGKSKWTQERDGGFPCGVTFAPDGKTLATGGGFLVEFWDTQTGKKQGFMETKGDINSCVFSRDGKNLVVAYWESLPRDWNFRVTVYEVKVMKTGTAIRHLED